MITKPTVLVLGAGASAAYGFPVGSKLIEMITDEPLTTDAELDCLKGAGFDERQYNDFSRVLKQSCPESIDAFLEHRQDYREIGKFAIALKLIQKEGDSSLYNHKLVDNWLPYLFHRLATSPDEFAKNKLSIVSFNYDRSVEHFLFTSLCNRYGWSEEKACDALSRIPVIHVYGQLCRLPWQADTNGAIKRAYSPVIDHSHVSCAAKGIHTIAMGRDSNPDFDNARLLLAAAEQVVFLGFGYQQDNMRRLDFPFEKAQIIGSCFGFTDMERNVLHHRYPGLQLGNENHNSINYLRRSEPFLRNAW